MSNKMVFRFTLLGDGAAGKTSIRKRFMGQGFEVSHNMTIGADFAAKEVQVEYNGRVYNVVAQIWDIAGQKRFQELRSRFYLGSKAGLLVFDITRPETFKNITSWIEELWRHNGANPPYIPVILLGNKADLRDRNSVDAKKAEEYCKLLSQRTSALGYQVQYLETSAKTGQNIEKAFEILTKTVIGANIVS